MGTETGQARTYECPACGARVAEAVRVCPYCRSPIATVRCAFCFHMNPPQSLHCSGCGIQLGLEPIAKRSGLVCPECSCPFDEFGSENQRLYDCAQCGGQFIDHSLLKDLLESRQVYGLKAARRPANPLDQPVRYRPCPVCKTMMNRQNFGRTSGVIVDICSRHGIWFDVGELPRVLDFVQGGGLLRAKQQAEPSCLSPRSPGPGDSLGGSPFSPQHAPSATGALADAAAELMAVVRRLLRG